jgi:replicative DNA helicase
MANPSLPHNVDAERALLGAVLIGGAAAWTETDHLAPEAFYIHRHRWIWDAMRHLAAVGSEIDVVTVGAVLEQHNQFGEAGGTAYLAQLMGEVPTWVNATDYATVVQHAFTARSALEVLAKAGKEIYTANGNLAEAIDSAAMSLDRLTPRKGNSVGLGEAALSWYARTMNAAEGKTSLAVPTGFRDLDAKTGGLNRKELCMLGGRPSMGKSSLAYQIAERVSGRGYRVGIFSLEDPQETVVQRLVFARLGLQRDCVTTDDSERIATAATNLGELPVSICDQTGLTVPEMRREAREMARQLDGLDLVIVDHLGYVAHAGEKGDNEVTRIGRTTKGLVRLAKEMDCAVLALVQLSRAVLHKANQEPDMDDMRDSGHQEQDARQVWFIHRPGYYADLHHTPSLQEPQPAFVIVRKNTNGPRNVSAKLAYVEAYSRFSDWVGL